MLRGGSRLFWLVSIDQGPYQAGTGRREGLFERLLEIILSPPATAAPQRGRDEVPSSRHWPRLSPRRYRSPFDDRGVRAALSSEPVHSDDRKTQVRSFWRDSMYRTLVSWLRISNRASRGRTTPAIALLFISAVSILSFPPLSYAAEDTELERLATYWKGEAPWCPSPAIIDDKVVSIEFASKDQHEKSAQGDRIPCNDGDSIMFNGLLCLAGVEADQTDDKADAKVLKPLREVGCNVVKYSQTTAKELPRLRSLVEISTTRLSRNTEPATGGRIGNHLQQRSRLGRHGVHRSDKKRRCLSRLDAVDKRQRRHLPVQLLFTRRASSILP